MDTTRMMEELDNLGERARPTIAEAKQKLGRINGRVKSFIQDHPAACLLGALALGYLVARLARRQG
jgi:hypothetical protein